MIIVLDNIIAILSISKKYNCHGAYIVMHKLYLLSFNLIIKLLQYYHTGNYLFNLLGTIKLAKYPMIKHDTKPVAVNSNK